MFDQSTISDPRATRDGAELLVSWASSSPDGTVFQLYISRRLAWHGTATSCVVALPPSGVTAEVAIGAVAAGEDLVDFSASLPSTPANRATLTWEGGTWEAADLAGFRVYAGASAGSSVSYTTPVADVPADATTDGPTGYGRGGYGQGGYGNVGGVYSWTSGPLAPGTWHFGIKPYDAAGNEGTALEATADVMGPPGPPGLNPAGGRLTYTFNATTHRATLSWLHPD
jgi:hypothetical protein